ncbi:PfkB family carbohydrate kinase [Quadrisphaera sp. DSM 44207]|uniref:PfkB family carbohydrate kinase n=1 Tax=Quadrisphaera sp. DSM 44207 TaxID=1881057 RepID=UPI000881B39C|nr:PfkB family carbohydrate kinase [Quadrisphaera sp. DSM 44207]SDQ36160.1 Sugar or nucleoside kinase, ribokinase family [Quadrisphaera sp. DSM 44207]
MPAPPRPEPPLGVFVGLATLDVVHRVTRLAGRDEKVTAVRQDVAAGGPAAGAAVAFAALGGRARLVTALGPDAAGAAVRDDLRACGVQVVPAPSHAPTPVSAVQVLEASGERTVTSLDAAGSDVPAPPDLEELLDGADVVLLDGHHPRLALAAARAVAERRDRGAAPLLLLDAGRWQPVVADLLPLLDVAVCSADFRAPGAHDAPATAAVLLAAGVPVVATTAGPGPVRWWQGGRSGQVAVPAVRAVDTLGAGDAFHGACAWALACGAGTQEALAAAAVVAAHRVSSVGPRAWLAHLPPVPARRGRMPG